MSDHAERRRAFFASESRSDRILTAALWTLAFVIVASLVHLATILAMPSLSPVDAWARLAARAPQGTLHVLERAEPGREALRLNDPATIVGLCRYDLSEGPLRLRAPVSGDGLLTFSFRARDNRIFYAMTDRAAFRGLIDLLVVDAAQLAELEESDDDAPQDMRLVSPTSTGYVYIRSLAPLPSQAAEAEARLRAVQCRVER